MGLHGVTGTYKGLQLFVVGYKELLGLQEAKGCSKGQKGYIELLRVTRVYKEVKSFCLFDYRGVTRGYRIFRTKKLTRFLSRKPYRHSDAKS